MRKVLILGVVCGVAALATSLLVDVEKAEARPQYNKAVADTYKDNAAVKKAKCLVCHPVKDKKKRNNYGVAVGKGIGKKNQKDVKVIAEALTKAEKEKSATEGKTFGDLLKDGKLPGEATAAE